MPTNQPGFNAMSTGFFRGSNVLTKQDCLKSIVKSMTLEVKFQKNIRENERERERQLPVSQYIWTHEVNIHRNTSSTAQGGGGSFKIGNL